MPARGFCIEAARTTDDVAVVARLFRTYAAALDVDLCFQGFDDEVATLPGRYAPPGGTLLIARDDHGVPLGCVGLRALAASGRCEMKRLFLTEDARGRGIGQALVDAVLAAARMLGHREIVLDTLPTMHAAAKLYEAAGFTRSSAYYATPVAGTLFYSRML